MTDREIIQLPQAELERIAEEKWTAYQKLKEESERLGAEWVPYASELSMRAKLKERAEVSNA